MAGVYEIEAEGGWEMLLGSWNGLVTVFIDLGLPVASSLYPAMAESQCQKPTRNVRNRLRHSDPVYNGAQLHCVCYYVINRYIGMRLVCFQ